MINEYWYTDEELSAIESVRNGAVKLGNDLASLPHDPLDSDAASSAAKVAATAADAIAFAARIKDDRVGPLRDLAMRMSEHINSVTSVLASIRESAKARVSAYSAALSAKREAEKAAAEEALKEKVAEYKENTLDYKKWEEVNEKVEALGVVADAADSNAVLSGSDVSVAKRTDWDYEVVNLAEFAAHYPECIEISRAKTKSIIRDKFKESGDIPVLPGLRVVKKSGVVIRGK